MNWHDFIASPLWVSKPSLWLVGALCVLLIVPLSKVFIRYKLSTFWKIIIYSVSSLLLVWVCLGDAYKASLQYNKYCREESGMHIYQTAKGVESFLSDSDAVAGIAVTYDMGYVFTEYVKISKGNSKEKQYFKLKEDGSLTLHKRKGYSKSSIAEPVSQYYFYSQNTIFSQQIKKRERAIIVRESGKKLGELIYFYYYPGWLDRQIWGWLGDYSPPICGASENAIQELFSRVLIPVSYE